MKPLALYNLGGLTCGIRTEGEPTVLQSRDVHWLPPGSAHVAGISVVDNRTVTLFDLAACIGLAPIDKSARRYHLFVAPREQSGFGCVLPAPRERRETEPADVTAAPPFLATGLVDGYAQCAEGPVPVVNLAEAFRRIRQPDFAPQRPCFQLDASPPTVAASEPRYQLLEAGGCPLAVACRYVRSVAPANGAAAGWLPGPDFFAGVVLDEGRLSPVLRLAGALGLDGPPITGTAIGMDVAGQRFRFLVDGVRGQADAQPEGIRPLPPLLQAPWLREALEADGDIVPILDPVALLSDLPTASMHRRPSPAAGGEPAFSAAFTHTDVDVVEFELHGFRHALPADECAEDVAAQSYRYVPGAAAIVVGVADHRGELLPVLDLAVCYGAYSRPAADWRMIPMAIGDFKALVLAERVMGVRRLPLDRQRELPYENTLKLVYGCYPDAGSVRLIINARAMALHFDRRVHADFMQALLTPEPGRAGTSAIEGLQPSGDRWLWADDAALPPAFDRDARAATARSAADGGSALAGTSLRMETGWSDPAGEDPDPADGETKVPAKPEGGPETKTAPCRRDGEASAGHADDRVGAAGEEDRGEAAGMAGPGAPTAVAPAAVASIPDGVALLKAPSPPGTDDGAAAAPAGTAGLKAGEPPDAVGGEGSVAEAVAADAGSDAPMPALPFAAAGPLSGRGEERTPAAQVTPPPGGDVSAEGSSLSTSDGVSGERAGEERFPRLADDAACEPQRQLKDRVSAQDQAGSGFDSAGLLVFIDDGIGPPTEEIGLADLSGTASDDCAAPAAAEDQFEPPARAGRPRRSSHFDDEDNFQRLPPVDSDASPAAAVAGAPAENEADDGIGTEPPPSTGDADFLFLNDDALWLDVTEVAGIPEDLDDESTPEDTVAASPLGTDPAPAGDGPAEAPVELPASPTESSPIPEDEPDLTAAFADGPEVAQARRENGPRAGRRRQWLLAVLLLTVLLAAVAWHGRWISLAGWRQWLPFAGGTAAETRRPPVVSRPVPARETARQSPSRGPSGTGQTTVKPPADAAPIPVLPSSLPPGHITIVDRDGKVIVYKVKKGDTLWGISERYTGSGFNYPEMARDNEIENPDLIYPRQRIRVK